LSKNKKQKEIGMANMLRLYDLELLGRLNRRYSESRNRYESKNHFLTDLIESGLNCREYESSLRDKILESDTTTNDRIEKLTELFTEFIKYTRTKFQSIQASGVVARRILGSTNNLVEVAVLRKIIPPEAIKSGSYDSMPERFEKFEELADRNFIKNE